MKWLLLRGLSREQRHWGDFPSRLATATGGDAFCLDLAGTGTEHARPSPTTIAAITDDVRARLVELRAQHPGEWMILGISLGGMVAMDWAARFPGDFARVVLVNTSAANMSLPWQRMDWRILPTVGRALFMQDKVARERLILSITTRQRQDLDEVAGRWAAFQDDRPISRSLVLRQLFAASRFSAPETLTIPILLLSGGRDPLMQPICAQRLAAHLKIPLVVHPTAGHELALDAPDWLVQQVAEWLGTAKTQAV